ncbi:MAG: CHRD domain-containing protein [Alphaproteobacteria bacterium]
MRTSAVAAGLAGLSLLIAGVLTSPAAADTIHFRATLSGANEVPPITSPAAGSATLVLDTATGLLQWHIQAHDLTAPATVLHFHGPGTAEQNAAVVLDIGRGGESPWQGQAVLNQIQMDQVLAGLWYINIHTAAFPPGEIRGQVVKN